MVAAVEEKPKKPKMTLESLEADVAQPRITAPPPASPQITLESLEASMPEAKVAQAVEHQEAKFEQPEKKPWYRRAAEWAKEHAGIPGFVAAGPLGGPIIRDLYRRGLEKPPEGKGVGEWWGELKKEEKMPFIGPAMEATKHFQFEARANKVAEQMRVVEQTQYPDEATREDAILAVLNSPYAQEIQKQIKDSRRGLTFWADVLDSITDLPAWMVEFWFTAPAAAAGRGVGKSLMTKILGKYAAGRAGKLAVGAAGWTAAGAARTTTGLLPRVAEEFARRRMGQYEVLEDGRIVQIETGDTITTAAIKAFLSVQIEAMSEEAGPALMAGGGRLLGKIPGTKTMVAAIGGKLQKFSLTPAIESGLRRAGFHGIVGEFLEERLGDVMRVAGGLEPVETLLPSARQVGVELLTFSVPGLSGAVAARIARAGEAPPGPVVPPEYKPPVTGVRGPVPEAGELVTGPEPGKPTYGFAPAAEEARYAEEIRADKRQAEEARAEPEGRERPRREDLQRPTEARAEARYEKPQVEAAEKVEQLSELQKLLRKPPKDIVTQLAAEAGFTKGEQWLLSGLQHLGVDVNVIPITVEGWHDQEVGGKPYQTRQEVIGLEKLEAVARKIDETDDPTVAVAELFRQFGREGRIIETGEKQAPRPAAEEVAKPLVEAKTFSVKRGSRAGTADLSLMRAEDVTEYLPKADVRGPWYFFNRLFVPSQIRKQGVAAKLMQELVDWADEGGYAVLNPVDPYGDLTLKELVDFYKRYGFVESSVPQLLFRQPTAAKPPAAPAEAKQLWEMTKEEYALIQRPAEGVQAAFRVEGKIYPVGPIHNFNVLPAEIQSIALDKGMESGFVGPQGLFFKAEDAPEFRRAHYDIVKNALAAGKHIPAEVLADYPGLAKPEAEVAPPAPKAVAEKPLEALERAPNAAAARRAALAGIEAKRKADMAAPELDQATEDWAANRLYLQGKNWRLKTKSGKGPIAPYNSTLKAAEVTPNDLDARAGVTRALGAKPTRIISEEEALGGPGKVRQSQLTAGHKVAKAKALINDKGKPRPGYRRLAKAMTGKTSMAKMSQYEAAEFIRALEALPEPTYKAGRLIPPSIPKTTRLAAPGEFDVKFKKPMLLGPVFTSQSYYAKVLGVGKYTRPLETGKQRFDLEYRKAAREVERWVKQIDKIAGTTLREKAKAKLKNRPTAAVRRMWELLNKHEEAPADLNEKERETFNRFRGLTRRILERENQVRKSLGIEPIKKRQAYVRHVADMMAKEILEGRYPFPEGLKYWSERLVGQKTYNAMEMQRKFSDELNQLFTRDLGWAMKSMLWTGLKEIHLSQPLKFFSEQLGAISKDVPIYKGQVLPGPVPVIPAATKKWLISYVNAEIKGQQTWLDEQVNRVITETGLQGVFNQILKPFGRNLSRRPVTRLLKGLGRLNIMAVLGPRPKLVHRNLWQRVQCLALYGWKANLKGFLPARWYPAMESILDESLFLKSYTGIEELPQGVMKKLERWWLSAYQWSARSNAKHAMKVAYHGTIDLIQNPKYKEYGWADAQRTYKEGQHIFYPTERTHLLREMELGSSATQYQYIGMAMPGMFRHKTLIPATRLQSWWMNHFFKFQREAANRFFKGETAEGMRLPWSHRLGWFRYLIFGGMILNTLGYWRSYLFGAAPDALPPALQLALAGYIYLTSTASGAPDSPWKRKKEAEARYRFLRALKTFVPGYLTYRDVYLVWSGKRSLKSMFFYTKIQKKKAAARRTRARRARRGR